MKNKITYLAISFFCLNTIIAQVRQFDLVKGNCQWFNGSLYSYGISSQKKNAGFCLYKLNSQLKIMDSIFADLPRSAPDDYLQIYSDTLHDHLNIYLQKKEKKVVTIFRFNKKSELVATIENVDIARLNNTSLFTNEIFYLKNEVYTIKTESDTSGKQFYLNKYLLKSETQNFDYDFKWQFPFERKNIHSAHLFFANKKFVLLYVMVNVGTRKGQWLLKIDSEQGILLKATKINGKGESSSYLFGDYYIDSGFQSLHLVGQKYSEAQFDLDQNKLSISNTAYTSIYYTEIDSLGEIVNRQDFKIPINDIKTGVKKTINSYLLRFNSLVKKPEGTVSFECDVFKAPTNSLCFLYCNTTRINLVPGGENLELEKNTISPNLLVEEYYSVQDKLDMNGKLCIDSLNQFDKIFYKPLTFPVKQQFKFDMDKNPIWILTKHTSKKNAVNYSFLSPVKKIYKLTAVEEISELNNPVFTNISPGSFIISSQPEEGKYQLKLYNW